MIDAVLIIHVVFYVFATLTVAAAAMVVFSRNPMHSVLFLVLCFVSSAVLWLLLQAEFLALLLIFVYVGAVMTLFLFVVMMLNVDLAKLKQGFVRYLPYAALLMLLFLNCPFKLKSRNHITSFINTLRFHPDGLSFSGFNSFLNGFFYFNSIFTGKHNSTFCFF